MASEPNPKLAGGRTPGGRTTPVLVPQAALAGQPDIPLDRPVTTVGSNDSARLHLVSRTVSKGHAIFVNSGGVTYVADLSSRTGVIVNGKLIKDVDLKTGDRVQIGKFVFRYRSPTNVGAPPPAIMPPPAAVIVVGSPAKTIDGRVFQIGRKEACEICFPLDAAVSAGHAVIFEMDGRWYLRDLGSRTGTIVNGKPIHQHALNFGDRISIGSSTILFQPGAAPAENLDDSSVELDALSDSTPMPIEVQRAEQAVVPAPQAAADDDAIPLAGDFPAGAVDWKSAFRGTDPDQDAAAAEFDRALEPIAPKPQPVANVEAIELSPISIDDSLQPASIDPDPVDQTPVVIEPQTIPVEESVAPVESGEGSTAVEKAQNPALWPAAEPDSFAQEPVAVEPEAIAIDEVVEPLAVESKPIAIEETVESVANEPEPIAVEEVVEPIAVEPEPVAIEETVESVANEPEPIAVEEVVEPIAVDPEPIAIEETVESVESKSEPIEIKETVEPVANESEPVAIEEVAKPVMVEPAPITAEQPKPSESPAVAVADLVEPVEDFVFVPVDEKADPNALPELIFWGDAELDSVTAQAAITPVVAQRSPVKDAPPSPVADMAAPPEISAEQSAEIVTQTAAEPHDSTPVAETEPEIEQIEPVDEIPTEGESPVPVSEKTLDGVEDATPESSAGQPAEAFIEPVDEHIESSSVEEIETPGEVATEAETLPPVSVDAVDAVDDASAVTETAAVDEMTVEGDPFALGSEDLIENASNPPADLLDEGVHQPSVEAAFDLVEEVVPPAEETPVLPETTVELPAVQAVAVPQELHAFSAASAATAGVYGHETSPSQPATAPTAGDLSSFPVAEELGADSEPVEKFIDVASDIDLISNIPAAAVEPLIDESFDLDDLELLEPQTVTHTSAPNQYSGISTVDEIHADDEGEHPSGFQEVDAAHEALAVEETPALVESPPEYSDISETIDHVEQEIQPIEIAGTSTVEEICTDNSVTRSEDFASSIPEPESNESDLEFVDAAPPAIETTEPPDAVPPPQKPAAAGGPSIFGIQFEGGSFLGGMPISLREKPPTVAPPVAPSPVFDARSVKPTGLDGMVAPPAPTPTVPPVPPPTPPRPMAIQPTAPIPTSLSGLVSDAHLPWAVPPVIPPTTRPATPPAKPGLARKALSSNFAATKGEKPRVADVFSQMSAPIGVEVFGGRPGDPNQFTVPETKKGDDENRDLSTAPTPVIGLPPAKKPRRSLLPLWSVLAVLVPFGLFGLVYRFWPVNIPVIGSLTFDGLVTQPSIDDAHTFRDVTQPMLIRSDEVRQHAQAILEQKGLPDGFTHDQETYSEVFKPEFLNWDQQKTFQFTYNTTNAYLGEQQVAAVMTALAEKNQDLNVAKYHATVNARAAKRALDESAAKIDLLKRQRHELLSEAQDFPDAMIVAQADQDAATLNQQWTDAKTLRANNEKVLADLRGEDPTKPIDIEADQKVQDLKNQLQPILDQIAKLKGIGSVDPGSKTTIGTDVSVGATTQSDTNIDPLINPLQERADVLSKKLDQRRSELEAEVALGPEQRAVNLSREIEDLSVKITNLKRIEADAEVAAKQATAKANDLHAKVTAARVAGAQVQDKESQLAQAEMEHKQRRIDQEKQEAILASCITPSGLPSVEKGPVTDMRFKLGASVAIAAFLFFAALVIGEFRRPKLIAGVTPAAAPLANPPVRLIPWPQPRETNGVEGEHQRVGEPEQMLGV